tara:strand:- start:92 stop:271 length:180 start_codon:yes stop_codon:yes gene_type:complete
MEVKNQKINKILPLKKNQKCPICKKTSIEQYVPFCSTKCANLDLMKWLSDEYKINVKSD